MLVGLAPPELVPVNCVTLIPDSSLAALSPLLVMLQFAIWRPLIPEPPMPLPRLLVILMKLNETFSVVVSKIPSPEVSRIVPPVPALPVPVTLRPPDVPVLFRTIPFVGAASVPSTLML